MKTHNLLTAMTTLVAGFCLMVQPAMALTTNIDTLNVQGYMKRSSGTVISDGTYALAFGVMQGTTVVWTKKQNVVVTNGLFSASLTGASVNLPVDAVNLPATTGLTGITAGTLGAALLTGAATTGEVKIRVHAFDPIDGAHPDFDITLGATPTAMVAAAAQTVVAGGIDLAALSAVTSLTTANGKIPTMDGTTGLLDISVIPPIPSTGITGGSITGTGSITYKASPTGTTTIGDNSSSGSTVVTSGSGGLTESSAGSFAMTAATTLSATATGAMTLTGAGVTVNPGATGALTLGNASSTQDTTIQTGAGNLLLSPASGFVRVTGGNGIDLINGTGSVRVKSPLNPTSYVLTLPGAVGANNTVLLTDNTGVTSWSAVPLSAPAAIGSVTPNTGAFTTLSATGQITSTLATGTAPFAVASTTNVANLNASSLNGATFDAPGAIGGTTAAAGTFTTLGGTAITGSTSVSTPILTSTSALAVSAASGTSGSAVTLAAGAGSAGVGGAIGLTAGAGTGAAGGAVTIAAGSGTTGNFPGGAVSITSGAGGTGGTTGLAGAITIAAGAAGTTAATNGAPVTISAGASAATGAATGGALNLNGGSSAAGTGGSVVVTPGTGVTADGTFTGTKGYQGGVQAVSMAGAAQTVAGNGAAVMNVTVTTAAAASITTITGCNAGKYALGQQLTVILVAGAGAFTWGLNDTAVATANDSLTLSAAFVTAATASTTARGSQVTLMCTQIGAFKQWVEISRSVNAN